MRALDAGPLSAALSLLLLFALGACHDDAPRKLPPKPAPAPSASGAPVDAGAVVPTLDVDIGGVVAGDKSFAGAPSVWGPKLAAHLAKNPAIAGKELAVAVTRDTRMPTLVAVLAALEQAKATGAVVTSRGDDGGSVVLHLAFGGAALSPCAVVATVDHTLVVDVASRAGAHLGKVQRSRDPAYFTRIAALVDRHAATCDAPAWVFRGAATIPWALAADIIAAAEKGESAAGKSHHLAVIEEGPTAPRGDGGR